MNRLNKKRVINKGLSLFVALGMLLSLCAIPVWAEVPPSALPDPVTEQDALPPASASFTQNENETPPSPSDPSSSSPQSVPESSTPSSEPVEEDSTATNSSSPDESISEPREADTNAEENEAEEQVTENNEAPVEEDQIAVMAAPQDVHTYFPGGNGSILSNMTLTYQDANGEAVDEPNINSVINFNFDVTIPASVAVQVNAGDYYNFVLPSNVSVLTGINGVQLYDSNGVLYGTFSVTPSNDSVDPSEPAQVRIVFTDEVKNSGGLTGNMYFQGNFNKNEVTRPGSNTITIPGEGNISATLNIKPIPGSSIDKQGAFTGGGGGNNPTGIDWTIDFNKSMDTLTNAVFRDDFPNGLDLDPLPAPSVYRVSVDVYGNVVDDPAPELITEGPDTYTVEDDGSIRFNTPISDCYRVQYSTTISPDAVPTLGGALNFTNNASLQSTEITEPITASSSLTAQFDKELSKMNSGMTLENHGGGDTLNPTFHWTVNYNGTAGIDGVILTDIYDDAIATAPRIQFDQDSFHIYTVSYVNGQLVRGDEVPNDQYELIDTPDDGNGQSFFTVEFANPVADEYNNQLLQLEYDTYATGEVQQDFSKPNTIYLGGGTPSSTSQQAAGQQILQKSLINVDRDTETLEWQVVVNQNRYELENLLFEDAMSSGLSYIYTNNLNDGFVIEDITNPASPITLTGGEVGATGVDYTLGVATPNQPEDAGDIITVTFLSTGGYNPTDRVLRITYETRYDLRYLPAAGSFSNTASITSSNRPEIISTGNYTPTGQELNNGGKEATYDAVSKTITWAVFVDYANTGFRNAYLLDRIQNDLTKDPSTWQSFVPGSVRVYHYIVEPGGPTRRGPELTEEEYEQIGIVEPSGAINSDTYALKVTFPDAEDPPVRYWVEYQTSVSGQSIQARYNNTAALYNDLYPPTGLTAHVDIRYGGQLVAKSGQQGSDGYAYWQVLINPSQSSFPGTIEVVDTPSSNQTILEDSLVIYPGSVDANGNISPVTGSPLVAGQDYTFSYAPVGGVMTLTVNIPLPAGETTNSNTYVMQYKASLQYDPGEAVTNNVQVVGQRPADNGNSTRTDIVVTQLTGGGILVGEKVSFSLLKQGVGGAAEPLAGVTFHLYDRNGNRVGGDYVTGADGRINFTGLVQDVYTLREVSLGDNTANNYVISDDYFLGELLNVTSSTGTVVVANQKSRVVLTKLADGNPLPSGLTAVFGLYIDDNDDGIYEEVVGSQNFTTGEGGQLVIDNLAPGRYQLQEKTAPTGYVLNTVPLNFEFTADANRGMTPPVVELEHINYSGSVSFLKTDDQGDYEGTNQPVAGAEFTILNNGGTYYEDVAYSGTDGMVYFNNIPPGEYEITETAAPPGWPGNAGGFVIPVTIPNAAAGNNDPDNPINVVADDVVNALIDGTVEIFKSNAAPEGQAQGLAGAEFSVYSADNLDTPIRTGLITNTDGNALVTGLAAGDYVFVETKAPTGYLRNTNAFPFTVTDGALGGAPVPEGPFINYTQTVQLQKQDANGNALPGAVFSLTRDDTGEVVGGDYVSDDAGLVTIEGLGPGEYTLLEVEAPEGFLIDTWPIHFTVEEAAAGQPDVLPLNDGAPFINYTGGARLRKTNATGASLAGAEFRLTRTDGGPAPQNTTYRSVRNGTLGIGGLAPGQYRLTEVRAPEGFIRNTTPIDFTIPAGQPGQPEVVVLDDFANYTDGVRLTKTNENGELLAGAEFDLVRLDAAGEVPVGNYSSNNDGLIEVMGLPPGRYEFRETKAPLGYVLATEAVSFEIVAAAPGQPNLVEVRAVNIQIVDPAQDGTKTGDNNTVWRWLLLSSTAVIAVIGTTAFALKKRKKRTSNKPQ